jgi:type III pantothenate kinase
MIVVDIGNTSVHVAWVRKNKIVKMAQINTLGVSGKTLNRVLSKYPDEKIFVCSVVPKITKIFKKLKRKVYVVGEDINVPVRCFYNKKKIGMDRLVGAFAVKKIYPHTRLIIDFGTAITFDFLSGRGDYQGGFILPGIGSTLKVLSSCALLPKKIKLKETARLIPRDTRESISKGIEEGFSAMINSLIEKYKKILKFSSKNVVVTGGDAASILPKLKSTYIYEPFLIIKGLIILSNQSLIR